MKGLSFIVDKLTNSIEDPITCKVYETEVLSLTQQDLRLISKKNKWKFNWKEEFKNKNKQLFKLVIKDEGTIQGLISLEPDDMHVEMHLIETAPHNFGKSKKYNGVAGNLVGFACKMSFELGQEGCVAWWAKTKLIEHYINKLKARILFKNRMEISDKPAQKLVNSYFKDFIL